MANRDHDPSDILPETQPPADSKVRVEHRPLDAGTLVANRFEIGQCLGAGGMGVVYRAIDRVLDRSVAVKVLQSRYGRDAQFMARFLQEAKIVAGLSSNPHVVALYDVGKRDDGAPYLVMEFLEGRTLRSVLESSRIDDPDHPDAKPKCSAPIEGDKVLRLSRSWVVAMGRHIAAALYDAHAKGVTHRDLKPENVFVLEARTLPFLVKVLDFGLARSTSAPLPDVHATEPGSLLGTPPYMAPEQIGGETTSASDIYSLGLMLYEAATGRSPYRARTAQEWFTAHLVGAPAPLPEQSPAYPSLFGDLITAMLRKEPTRRPTARAALQNLSRVEEEIEQSKRR